MKYLRSFVILMCCTMLSTSAGAVLTRTPDEDHLSARLGIAVYAALKASENGALEENRSDHSVFFEENRKAHQKFKRLEHPVFNSLFCSTKDEREELVREWRELCVNVGHKYVEDPSLLIQTLKALTKEGPIEEGSWLAAYHRAYLLLKGIGIEEGQQSSAKTLAFTLIARVLEYDGENKSTRKLLFKHFLPGNPLALDHLRRLEETVAIQDKEEEKYDPKYPANRYLRSDVQLLEVAHKAMGQSEASR